MKMFSSLIIITAAKANLNNKLYNNFQDIKLKEKPSKIITIAKMRAKLVYLNNKDTLVLYH